MHLDTKVSMGDWMATMFFRQLLRMWILRQSKVRFFTLLWVIPPRLRKFFGFNVLIFFSKCHRMVTVRELARSQGFPDNFVFEAIGQNIVTVSLLNQAFRPLNFIYIFNKDTPPNRKCSSTSSRTCTWTTTTQVALPEMEDATTGCHNNNRWRRLRRG